MKISYVISDFKNNLRLLYKKPRLNAEAVGLLTRGQRTWTWTHLFQEDADLILF